MSKRITIIIPTHEREFLLQRALAYYSNFEYVNIIICDSSTKHSLITIPVEITYLHLPGYSFASKLLTAIEKVSTPYACLSADDDFFVESSLINAADFLKQNIDYVAVTGQYIHFILTDNQEVLFNPLYNQQATKNREYHDARERVLNSLNSNVPLILALFRTEILKNSVQAAAHTTKITNVEIACNIVPMIFGKSKKLQLFFMARDAKRYTRYNESSNDINSVISDYSNYLLTDDGLTLRKTIVDLISINLGIKPEDAYLIFDKTLNSYITAINYKKDLNSKSAVVDKITIFAKKLTPLKVINLRRRLIMKNISIGGGKIYSDENYLKIEKIVKEFGAKSSS